MTRQTTDPIIQPIADELRQYEALFASCLSRNDGMLDMALRHLAQCRGKAMRPKLMLLCAKACGRVDAAVLHAAAAVELLHTASLVHDDIVDESDSRRGQQSVNALLGNKAAVLVGDYLLSTALTQAALTGSLHVNSRLAWLGQTLAEGELMQLDCTAATDVDENAYREVIRRKTASLFAVCAELGATLAGGDSQPAFMMGEAIGMAFQMRDDMFDYYAASQVGKPTGGADLREGKITLPLIHAVNTHPHLLPLALKARAQEATEAELTQLMAAAVQHGMDYTRQCMHDLTDKAKSIASHYDKDTCCALNAYIDLVTARSV